MKNTSKKNKKSEKQVPLGQHQRRVLLQDLIKRALVLFNRLDSEVMDLDVMNYFELHYRKLYKTIHCMERFYPDPDISTNNADLLYKRIHMHDQDHGKQH